MFNTTNLVQHLQKHSDKFKKHEKEKDDNAIKQPQALKQFTVEQMEDRAQPWSINDLSAQRVTCHLVEMVALDFLLSKTPDL